MLLPKRMNMKRPKLVNIHENRIRNDPISTGVSISGAKTEQNDDNARQYLIVPYRDKDLAKAAGACWDKAARAWFVGPEADIQTLQRWLPENVANQQEPAIDPHVEFADLLRAQGCLVDGNHPVMDSSTHRIKVIGDKSGEKSGFMWRIWMVILPDISRIIEPV